jgi:urease accessory protein
MGTMLANLTPSPATNPRFVMNLALLQIGDSALPIGGYSHSWGLEAAIDRGLVRDPAGLERWARNCLRFALAPCEGVVVAVVCRAVSSQDWATVQRANDLLAATITPTTLRHASRDMGEHLLALAESWRWSADVAGELRRLAAHPWHHPVVFGVLAGAATAGPVEAVLVYLHQAALGSISAGVRAVPVGHTHGQQILARLHDDLHTLAAGATERDLDDAGSYCPAYEVLCHAQSRLYTRLFRS